jgi:hemerythrin-like domain-containing protein
MTRADVTIPSHCPTSAALLMPVPPHLLAAPLDYIAADHARQRCVCAYLKQMAADQSVARADAEAVFVFMTEDLQRHHADEDADLFPALRRRALREDALDAILDRLAHDHDTINHLASAVVTELTGHHDESGRWPARIAIGPAGSVAMDAYAACMLQHLSVECGIVLVLARKRLTAGDLATMSRNMTVRRGGIPGV